MTNTSLQTQNETPIETPAVVPIQSPIVTPVQVPIERPIQTHIQKARTEIHNNPSIETPTDLSFQTEIQPIQSPVDPVEPQVQTLLKIQRGIKLY